MQISKSKYNDYSPVSKETKTSRGTPGRDAVLVLQLRNNQYAAVE